MRICSLIQIMDKEIELYKEMKILYLQKKDILIKNNISELSIIDKKIINNYEVIKKIDLERLKVIQSINQEIPNMQTLINFSIKYCPEYTEKLKIQKLKLSKLSIEISILNKTNIELVKHGIILTDKKLNLIIKACTPKEKNYSKYGKITTLNNKKSTIIQEA